MSSNNIILNCGFNIYLLQFCTVFLQASQRDNPDRYSTSLVRVIIQAANENPPRFVEKEYNVDLVENVPIGTTVARLEAFDNDMVSFLFVCFM